MRIMRIKISPNGDRERFEDEGRTLYLPCDECTEGHGYCRGQAEGILDNRWKVISVEGPLTVDDGGSKISPIQAAALLERRLG